MADHHKMLLGARHGNVELAVDDGAVGLLVYVAGQEVKLIVLLNGEPIDDILPLTALETLYRVDGDIVEDVDAVAVDEFSHRCRLVAVRHDDTHCLVGVSSMSVSRSPLLPCSGSVAS